jgi:hypothetical protein
VIKLRIEIRIRVFAMIYDYDSSWTHSSVSEGGRGAEGLTAHLERVRDVDS